MSVHRSVCVFAVAGLLAMCNASGGAVQSKATHQYPIGARDVLMILLFDQDPKYSGDVTVRPDGKITLPLVHEIQAAGLTPRELKEALTKAYAKYFSDPVVWVVVKEINSLRVSIIGEVVKPGEYRFTDSMNVLQLIALAGGFTVAATKESIVIIRKTPLPDGRPNRILFNYEKLIQGFPPNEIPQLEPGDQVLIK